MLDESLVIGFKRAGSTYKSEMPCPLITVLHEWSHEMPAVSRGQPVKLRRS